VGAVWQARSNRRLHALEQGREYDATVATAVPLVKMMKALDRAPRRLVSTLQDPEAPDPTPFREVFAPTTGGVPFEDV
jgi:hypothetical protein